MKLWQELCAQGFTGSYCRVTEFARRCRQAEEVGITPTTLYAATRREEAKGPMDVLTPENQERLTVFLEGAANKNITDPGINTYNALDSCGLGFFYTHYRQLSIRAAHATLLSAVSLGTEEEVNKLLERTRDLLRILDAVAVEVVRLQSTGR